MRIQEYLNVHKLITDGAFGTYYAEKYETDEMPELANETYGERVLTVHHAYIEAGAKLIRTNTFASNPGHLSPDMEIVKANIKKGIALAKQAVSESGHEIFIAGDIGPIPEEGIWGAAERFYDEICQTFMEDGLEILTFETFSDMSRILPAIERIKKEYDPFIMVQFSVNQFGYSASGLSAGKLLAEAAAVDSVDAIGLNCGIGPGHMEQILRELNKNYGKYMIALPNAGYPKRTRNRLQFTDNRGYFVEKEREMAVLGADILGGCCGTNPAYIKLLAKELDVKQKPKEAGDEAVLAPQIRKKNRGFFLEKDGRPKTKKLIAVELAPPLDANDQKILDAAHQLKKSSVDVVTFPDSPSGRTRVDSILMAAKVKLETGLEVMPHICCRDKNAIAMRSTLMGAKINNIQNLLVMTGDPIPALDRQSIKSVFNFDAVGLMKIIQDMNDEVFLDGPLAYGGAINQGRRHLSSEIERVKKKMAAGAEYFLSQPVFSKEDGEGLRRIKEATGARILCGIMPLISRRNALFMKNEIAGIHVPEGVIERYPVDGSKEEGEAVGVAIAREVMEWTKDYVDGYYFSFPFNRVYLLDEILKA